MRQVFESSMKKNFWFWVQVFCGNVISWVVFYHFGSSYLAQGPTTRGKYFTQVFIGN